MQRSPFVLGAAVTRYANRDGEQANSDERGHNERTGQKSSNYVKPNVVRSAAKHDTNSEKSTVHSGHDRDTRQKYFLLYFLQKRQL